MTQASCYASAADDVIQRRFLGVTNKTTAVVKRSRTFYRPVRPESPSSARPYCLLALSAHYDSAIRRAVAVLCSQRTSDEINEAI